MSKQPAPVQYPGIRKIKACFMKNPEKSRDVRHPGAYFHACVHPQSGCLLVSDLSPLTFLFIYFLRLDFCFTHNSVFPMILPHRAHKTVLSLTVSLCLSLPHQQLCFTTDIPRAGSVISIPIFSHQPWHRFLAGLWVIWPLFALLVTHRKVTWSPRQGIWMRNLHLGLCPGA